MQTRILSKVTGWMIAASMSCGSLFARPAIELCAATVQTETRSAPDEALQLLREIQTSAGLLTRDAATLESFRRMGVSSGTHAIQLNLAKEHINTMGKHLQRLQAIRGESAPWQQQAIDSLTPVAARLATRTTAAILHLSENRNHLWAPAYHDHLKAVADHAEQMKEFVDLHLELAGTEDKLEALRDKVAATVGS